MIPLSILAMALTGPSMGLEDARALQQRFTAAGMTSSVAAQVELIAGADGRVVSCDVVHGEGEARAVAAICPQVRGFRLKSVAQANGKPIFAKFRPIVSFSAGNDARSLARSIPRTADITVDVGAMPDDVEVPQGIYASILVGEDGLRRECGSLGTGLAAVVDATCGQLGTYDFGVVHDGDGKPVPYVTSKVIRFIKPGEVAKETPK
jgi:hypothetical protein